MSVTKQVQAVTRVATTPYGFLSARVLESNFLNVPAALHTHLAGIIDQFEAGTITLLESDQISAIHSELHTVMINATQMGWVIKLIDIANCFNPHLITSIAFNTDMHPQQILHNISLARPFQLHQSVSIIKQLAREVNQTGQKHPVPPQLIVITDISAQFFDPSLASEDKSFPIPQLELLRHVLGILRGLVTQGHMIIMTEHTMRKNYLEEAKRNKKLKKFRRVQASSLAYAANVHIRIETSENERKIHLLNHPFLPQDVQSVKVLPPRKVKKPDAKQSSLYDWYEDTAI